MGVFFRGLVVVGLLGLSLRALNAQDWILPVQAPPFTRMQAEGATLQGDPRKGEYLLDIPSGGAQPVTLHARGPFGGAFSEQVSPPYDAAKTYHIPSGIIADPDSNPSSLLALPSLCPRLKIVAQKVATGSETFPHFLYQGSQDPLNRVPLAQMGDPDATQGSQAKTVSEMDGRNVLQVQKIRITYDYEDSNIIDYEGPDPRTGKHEVVYEGMRGFYSNFHYAVIPYAPGIADLPRQTLLHLAEGSLREIGREDLRPALRTHAFFPGPFFSKQDLGYALCEWGDTQHQAPMQELEYEDVSLWDWDYSVPGADRVLLIVWESDEPDELRREGKIPPHYLVDDLVGVFEIRREDTLVPRLYKNPSGYFQITFVTKINSEPEIQLRPLAKDPAHEIPNGDKAKLTQSANNSTLSLRR